jgi:predicted GNAT family N-acyltransferase
MKENDYTIEKADWVIDANELKAIRTSVFIDEQDVPAELEWDDLDADSTHFIVRSKAKAIATARLKPDGQIGRMAVLKPYRDQGVGKKLLNTVLNHAIKTGFSRVYLHAQVKVVGFYEKQGFTAEGDEFMDAGIPHRAMYKKIC